MDKTPTWRGKKKLIIIASKWSPNAPQEKHNNEISVYKRVKWSVEYKRKKVKIKLKKRKRQIKWEISEEKKWWLLVKS